MPKPTTYQRPMPVNRDWSRGRPGTPSHVSPPFKKAKKPTPETAKPGLQLDLKLPRLPLPKG